MQTQTYNDGVLTVYTVKPGTPYGRVTAEDLVAAPERLRYQDRKVGMARYWQGFAAGARISRVLRVPLQRAIPLRVDMVVRPEGTLTGADYYTILQVQSNLAEGWQDLSLEVMGVDQGATVGDA